MFPKEESEFYMTQEEAKKRIQQAAEFWTGGAPQTMAGALCIRKDMGFRPWEAKGHRLYRIYEEMIKDMEKAVEEGDPPIATQSSLLDFGCGGGAQLFRFKKLFDDITGIDINPYALEQARQEFPSSKEQKFKFFPYDYADPSTLKDVVKKQFSCIISGDTFRTFPSEKYLLEVLDVLSDMLVKDGTFVFELRYSTGPTFERPLPYKNNFAKCLTVNDEWIQGELMARGFEVWDVEYQGSTHSAFYHGFKV